LLSLLSPIPAAAQPTGYQEYYVLGYEEHIWLAFDAIYEGDIDVDRPGQICSTVSLVATADYQVVYYDHWEDGYEADLLNPVQSTTEAYGDGDTSNGGTGSDILLAGNDINLTSNQDITGTTAITGYVPVNPTRNPADLRYDGGDRIITSGGPVALAHAMWPLGNSWVGGAWEVYSRQAYANAYSYRLPVGEDLYGSGDTYGDFRYVYLQLGAFEDNTTISIDNGDGDVVNLTLNRGQTYSSMGYINSTVVPSTTINAGTIIRSNKPTQVGLVTGADSGGSGSPGFQGRFLIVLPDQLWGADYIVPVPSRNESGSNTHQAEIYLSNPNDFEITVQAYDRFTQTTFVISPTTYISSTVPYSEKRGGEYVPRDTATRFTSSDGAFGVVVCADTSDTTYDWGFSGIPSKYLTQDYYVSWAPGNSCIPPDDPICIDGEEAAVNGSPVWVTPLADGTTFYVDFSPLDGVVDEVFTLDVLQQQRIFDPDRDNTGMHVWATSEFAVAWGEDPATATAPDPYLDLGLSTLPLLQRWLDPVLTLDKMAEPTVLPLTGGTVTFTLVAQAHTAPLVNLDITDTLPISWTYVPNSTHVTYPDGNTGNPEPTVVGRTLHWDLSANLGLNESLTLTLQAQITETSGVGTTAYDGFESGNYSGGNNWVGSWQEGGENDGPEMGEVTITDVTPFIGDYHLRIVSPTMTLSRTANLSGFTLPVLRFARQIGSIEYGEYFTLDVFNGVNWTTVLTWTDGSQENTYVQETVDLAPYASEATAVRFRSGNNLESDDYLIVDQVEIYDAVAVNTNQGEAVGKYEYSDAFFASRDKATVYISPLDLVKSVSSVQAEIGDTLVYTLAYVNVSDSMTATNVTLRNPVPIQHVTFQAASNGGVYQGASGTITWALGTLAPGASDSVTFTVTVNDFVADGTVIGNAGYINSEQMVEAGSNVVRTIVLAPNVELTKSGPTAAAQGQMITYTLSYENVGGAQATGVTIQDTIPVSTTYVTGSMAINTGSGWTALTDAADADEGAYISPTLTITPGATVGTIAAGEAGQIRFSVWLNEGLPPDSPILNSVTLDRNLDIPRESNLAVTRISDLLINKAAEQTVVAPGDVISYTLTYENVSETIGHTDVYVREPIPDYTSLISITESGGNQVEYSWDSGSTWSTTLPVTTVTHIRWYDAELPPNTQVTVGFTVQVTTTLPPNNPTIRNIGYIRSTETAEHFHEWIPTNQVELATITTPAGLIVDKSASARMVASAGEVLTYTITISNANQYDTTGIVVSDTLPAHTKFVTGSITLDPPSAGLAGTAPPILASEATIISGQRVTVTYAVTITAPLTDGTIITNTVSVTGTQVPTLTTDVVTTTIYNPVLTLTKKTDNHWTRRVKLSFDNSAQSEDLVNFPVLVVLDSSRINYTQTQDAGQDIRFIDADSTVLAHEIEKWDESGTSYVWVKVPQVDGWSNTDYVWMYYGNPSAADGQDPANVWTESYRIVYHLEEDPDLTGGVIGDSTTNGFDSTNRGSTNSAGFIANGQEFDGINQYAERDPDLPVLNGVSGATISCWIRPDTVSDSGHILGVSRNNGDVPTPFSRAEVIRSGANVQVFARSLDNDSDFHSIPTTTDPLTAGTWHYIAAVVDYANDTITITVDGVPQATSGSVNFALSTTPDTNSTNGALGSNDDGTGPFFDGLIDEARVASTARSADWIVAQYRSMTDAFITFGSEEDVTALAGPEIVGAPFTYTITITNTGLGVATNVVMTDTLPVGANYVSGGSYVPGSDSVNWMIPMIPANDSEQVTFVVSTCQTSLINASYRVVTSTQDVGSSPGSPLLSLLTPPTMKADFVYSPLSITIGSNVYFTSTSTTNGGPLVEWAWDFGDNSTGSGAVTSHTYQFSGTYTVTLTVTDTCGYTDTVTDTVSGATSYFATIYGAVFEDSDGDGAQHAGELGIPNVLITLDGSITTTTDLNGNYTFSTTVAGVHTVVETDPTVYTPILSDERGADFGGMPITLNSVPIIGSLTDLPGYLSTTPNEVHVNVTLGDNHRVDFGDALTNAGFASIHGTVFDDTDGDGVRDADELGIPGVLVTVDGTITIATNLNGSYTFSTTTAGVHTVVETDPDGHFSTTPNEVHVNVTLGKGYQVEFGDTLTSSGFAAIYGTVFNDANGNGAPDGSETGIASVIVTLDGDATVTTGPYGGYTFSTTAAVTHTVIETDLSGYSSTTLNEVHVGVILGHSYRVDFGDVLTARTCDADIYEEDDTVAQAVEFVVGTSQAHQFCDDAVDWAKFTAKANALYTITTSSWGQRADTFLALFDTNGHTLLAANDDYARTTDYSSRIVWQTPADGVYYVRTTNRAGLTGYQTDYDLVIRDGESFTIYLPTIMQAHDSGGSTTNACEAALHPTGLIMHTCPDAYETDDTWQQAHAIEVGDVQVHSFDSDPEHYAADKDFVQFDTLTREFIVFVVTPVTNTQTLMELYDEHGAALVVTGTTQLVWTPTTSGRYYLSVSPQDGAASFGCADTVGYNLSMETLETNSLYLPLVTRIC